MSTHRSVQIVALQFQCDTCGRFHGAAARFEGTDAVLSDLPMNCSCGRSLRTADLLLDLIATARALVANGEVRRSA